MTDKKPKLTPKQVLFVKEYQVDHNATKAAERAGYSKKTAAAMGSENLTKPHIRDQIAVEFEEKLKKVDLKAETVLDAVQRLAFQDVRKLFDKDGNLIPVHELCDEAAGYIQSIDVVEMAGGAEVGGDAGIKHVAMHTKKYKLYDRLQALIKLMEYFGMLKQRVSLENPDGTPLSDALAEVFKRIPDEPAVVFKQRYH